MSLTFDFPNWRCQVDPSQQSGAACEQNKSSWLQDLEEFSGSDSEESGPACVRSEPVPDGSSVLDGALPADTLQESQVPPRQRRKAIPFEALRLVLNCLELSDWASVMRVCRDWHDVLVDDDGLWICMKEKYLGAGWPKEPHAGARLVTPPAPPPSSRLLEFKATYLMTQVGVRFSYMRRGYEYLLEALSDLWRAVEAASEAASSAAPAQRLTHVDQLWQHSASNSAAVQVSPPFAPRAVMRVTDKLAALSWRRAYEGVAVAFMYRADEVAWEVRSELCRGVGGSARWCAAEGSLARGVVPGGWALDLGPGGGQEGMVPEPDIMEARQGGGPYPHVGLSMWRVVLSHWGVYRRWCELVAGRCAGLLGDRVAVERALTAAGGQGGPHDAQPIAPLLNKGLMIFREQVLLAPCLRRRLQHAALWLGAAAAADGEAWRSGGGLSDADLATLLTLRKMLTQLDVADDGSAPSARRSRQRFRDVFADPLLGGDRRCDRLALAMRQHAKGRRAGAPGGDAGEVA